MPALYLGEPPRVAIPKIEEVYSTIPTVLLKQISPPRKHTHRISAYFRAIDFLKLWINPVHPNMKPGRQVRSAAMPVVARKNVYIIRSHNLACARANLFRGMVKSAINQTAPGSAALASFAISACSLCRGNNRERSA